MGSMEGTSKGLDERKDLFVAKVRKFGAGVLATASLVLGATGCSSKEAVPVHYQISAVATCGDKDPANAPALDVEKPKTDQPSNNDDFGEIHPDRTTLTCPGGEDIAIEYERVRELEPGEDLDKPKKPDYPYYYPNNKNYLHSVSAYSVYGVMLTCEEGKLRDGKSPLIGIKKGGPTATLETNSACTIHDIVTPLSEFAQK